MHKQKQFLKSSGWHNPIQRSVHAHRIRPFYTQIKTDVSPSSAYFFFTSTEIDTKDSGALNTKRFQRKEKEKKKVKIC